MMWFAGLRGAIAFAIAIMNQTNAHSQLLTTTLIVVVFTVLVVGGVTVPLLKCLRIEMGIEEEEEIDHIDKARSRFWRFDRSVLIPFLTTRRKFGGQEINLILSEEEPHEHVTLSSTEEDVDNSEVEMIAPFD